MATPLSDLRDEATFWPMLQALTECLCGKLAEFGGPKVCYCGLWVGDQMPWLGVLAGDCTGLAWVRPVQSYPSTAFPDPLADGTRASCASPLAMQVEVGVARRFPRGTDARSLPDPQAMFDTARLYMSDMEAVRQAVACCFGNAVGKPERREWQHALGDWLPIPTGAGISGGSWTVFIG